MWNFPFLSIVYFLFGSLTIGIGGVLATYGIRLLGKSGKTRSAFFITLSAIVIGFGGFTTSYGWKLKDRSDNKRALIYSVARELDYNTQLIYKNHLFTKDSTRLSSIGLFYPRFTSGAAMAGLLSGVFNSEDEKDSSMQHLLSEIIIRTYDVNRRLEVSDNFSLSESDRERVMEHRLLVQRSVRLKWYLNLHNELDSFLIVNYTWLERQQK